MAKILSDNFYGIRHFGEYGDLSVADDGKTLAAASIADTVDFFTIPGGLRFEDGHMVNAALGASTTFSIGWRYVDGSAGGSATALLAATSTAAAARVNFTSAPFSVDKDIIVYGTLAGAAATGRLDAVVKYKVLGTK
jgi:hypothetical protein